MHAILISRDKWVSGGVHIAYASSALPDVFNIHQSASDAFVTVGDAMVWFVPVQQVLECIVSDQMSWNYPNEVPGINSEPTVVVRCLDRFCIFGR